MAFASKAMIAYRRSSSRRPARRKGETLVNTPVTTEGYYGVPDSTMDSVMDTIG